MKQIDEILDNLASSVGSRVEINSYEDKTRIEIINLKFMLLSNTYDEIYEVDTSLSMAKIKLIKSFLHRESFMFFNYNNQDKKFKLNVEKLIFEPVEEKLENHYSKCINNFSTT